MILRVLNEIMLYCLLGAALWQDIRTHKIKNWLNVTGAVLGTLLAAVLPERTVIDALAGLLVLFCAGLVLWSMKVMRAGDVKLLCAAGTFLGWRLGISCLLLSLVLGAIFGIPFLIRHRLIKKEKGLTTYPLSVAIAAACVLGMRFGCIWEWI